jgi:transcriptional regulator with XRE-family HTH domain
MTKETFGARLQRLRSAAGLTQAQLAERAGIPLTTLRNWEHDRREPMASALFKLANALNVDCRAFQDSIVAAQAEPPAKKKTRKSKS